MRAKPWFKLTLLAAALAATSGAQALGLGRLTVESSLGQPLSARIDLTSATREELDSLTARVADPSVYRQNNMQFQAALARTRVTVEQGPSGPYLRVTSPTSVVEPFLDLVVEVSWASGRVVRSYTFLLDPPGVQVQTVPVDPVTPSRGTRTASAPSPTAPVAAPGAPAAGPSAQPGEGYQVRRGDTLSKIANDVKPPQVTLDQMLVALFKTNASAFEGNNMNRLRTGAIITVPSADEINATPAQEATRVVRVQASDWRGYRDRIAAAAPSADGSQGRAAGGRIGAAVTEAVPSTRPGGDQLRVSPTAGGRGAAAASEDAVARDQQLREAQTRIAMLEKTIADLQKAVQMRSPTMAAAQQQAEVATGKAPPATTTAPPPAPITAAPKVEPTKVETPKIEPAKTEPPKAAPVTAAPPTPPAPAPTTTAEPPKAAATTPPPAPAATTTTAEPPKVAPPPAPKATPKVAEPPKAAPSFFEDLFANTPTWAIGGGALAILAGIAAIVAMRRRKTTKFEDSIISGTDIKTNTVFGSTGGGVVNTGDNSLASDFSREGLGNIDTDEVDPIAEAEVYLAYGRDAQAEEILKDALKKDPQRQEIYLKLLEIHAQHNKPSAFETVASELYAVSQGQGEVWHKAVALGRQLDPSNPMFAEGGAPGGPRGSRAPAPESDTFAVSHDYKPDTTKADKGFDMGLDEEISLSPTSGAAPKPGPGTFGEETVIHQRATAPTASGLAAAAAAGAGAVAAGAGAMRGMGDRVDSKHESIADKVKAAADKFDMEFKLDDDEKPAPMRKPEPALATAGAGAPSSGAAEKLARPAAALELDKLDLSFDPDKATYEDPTPSVLDGQWHDAATKLDLAKAYQEMGDVEGAREILQEVLHEGDDEQKKEAQAILGKLG